MEKKQTAVKWFQEQIIKIVNGTCELSENQIFLKALEMEKEQMKEAALDNVTTNEKLRKIFEIQFEDFFKETYGGQDE
jgi:hypothetical protein